MVLEVDNIELNFKHKRILSGIYIKAEMGSVTAILGSNGSGKSSLFNIIFGNLKPKYKLVRINGKPILKPLYKTGLVKYLPQYHFVPFGIKIRNIFKLFNVCWNDFVQSFETFEKYKNHKINKLSGGERRVVETYIILKSKSTITILDEPFSHIAPLYLETIKNLIREEKERKIILISDHLYKHIIDSADQIYLLKNGTTKEINNLSNLEDYKYLNDGQLD